MAVDTRSGGNVTECYPKNLILKMLKIIDPQFIGRSPVSMLVRLGAQTDTCGIAMSNTALV